MGGEGVLGGMARRRLGSERRTLLVRGGKGGGSSAVRLARTDGGDSIAAGERQHGRSVPLPRMPVPLASGTRVSLSVSSTCNTESPPAPSFSVSDLIRLSKA